MRVVRLPTAIPRLLAALALAVAAPGEAADRGSVAGTEEAAVREVHAAIRASALAGSADRLAGLLDDELTLSHAGIRQTKSEWLDAIRSGSLRYEAIDDEIHRVLLYEKAAVVIGHRALRLVWDGTDHSPRLQYTAVYVWRGGRWLLAAYHSDAVRHPPPARSP